MSGSLKNWTDGEAVTTPELQRTANAAAAADDLAFRVLLPTPATGSAAYAKAVAPLADESATLNPRLLVVPSTTAGKAAVRPAHYLVGEASVSAPKIPSILLACPLLDVTDTPAIASTVAANRVDVVYALIQRAAATATRKVKDVVTGGVSSQSITVSKEVVVTIGVQQGVEGAGVPALPADSSSAWYVPLAQINLTHPYVAGAALTQSQLVAVWPAAWIPAHRVRRAGTYAFAPASSGVTLSATKFDDRWGAGVHLELGLRQGAGSANYAKVDTSRDWRKRSIRVRMFKMTPAGTTPDAVTTPGAPAARLDSLECLTGTSGANFWTDASVTPVAWRANSATGALEVQFSNAGAPDEWLVYVDATDQFLS